MAWLQAQSGSKLGTFYRKKGNKLCVDVRFGEKHFFTNRIRSETEGKFYYDIVKLLERKFRGGAGSSRGSGDFLNFLEESQWIPLEGVLPENFQLCNRKMKVKLMSDILKLARDAAQKFEQSQAIRADMGHAQATHPPPKLSAQAIQSFDACLATVEQSFGRQRVDVNGIPLELQDASTLEEHSLKTDEGVGLCCPMDKIDDACEAWLSKCRDSAKDLANLADP